MLHHLTFKNIWKELLRLLNMKSIRQALVNFGAYFVAIACSIVTSYILTRNLGAENYGKMGLIITIVGTLMILTGWGFTEAYSRLLLAQEDRQQHRSIIGLGIHIFLWQSLALFILTIVILPFLNLVYADAALTKILFATNAVSCFYVFYQFVYYTTRETNNMYLQALHTVLHPLLYMSVILVLFYLKQIELEYIIGAFFITFIVATLAVIWRMQPRFRELKQHWPLLRKEQKEFGFHIYITQILERVSFSLDQLMLGMYLYSFVAFYSLGNMLTQPVSVFSNNITDSIFRNFTEQKYIPPKIFLYNFVWWAGSSLILLIIARPLITLLWGGEFLIIREFLGVMCLSVLFSNFYRIFYAFLYSKGIGKRLKHFFYIRTIANLAGNLLLIPWFGIMGACTATLLSNMVFCGNLALEYRTYVRNNG